MLLLRVPNREPPTPIIFPLAANPGAPNVAGRSMIWRENGTFGV